jgi:S1-C subfamily serine protease
MNPLPRRLAMKLRPAAVIAILTAFCLPAAGCLLLPSPPLSGPSPNESMPALAAPPYREEQQPTTEQLRELSPEERAVYEVYRGVNRGVVNITSVSVSYNWFLQAVPQEGTGSGSILDSQGNVLTNYHVIKGAERLFVTLYEGSNFGARVIGADPESDLAVVRFDPAGRELTAVRLGASKSLVVGQKVIALGNPFGLERTLTTGVVSGLRRPLQTPEGFIMRELIQTDAAINPGNSGGPLLNLKGEMIGINTMILAPAGGNIGIGFAVPVDTARRVIPDLLAYGAVKRGWIEIEPVPIFAALAAKAGLPVSQGILVSRAVRGGNAEKAGLRGGSEDNYLVAGGRTVYLGGDIILSIDRQPVWTLMDLLGVLESTRPGQTVQLEVLRSGQKQSIPVVLVERPRSMGW